MQESLKKLLEYEYRNFQDVNIWQGKEIKNVVGRKHSKVPDLIIQHPFRFHNQSYGKDVLHSPIGIEFKKGSDKKNGSEEYGKINIAKIVKGIVNQLNKSYINETYKTPIGETRIRSMLFTTPELIKLGYLRNFKGSIHEGGHVTYTKEYRSHELFIMKRVAWACNVGFLLKNPSYPEYLISYHNFLYDLFGNYRSGDFSFEGAGSG